MHKLPKLFVEIINHDNKYPEVGNVVGLPEYASWKKRKLELSIAAEKFIKRQRSS